MAAETTTEKGVRDVTLELFDNAGHTYEVFSEDGDAKIKKPKPAVIPVRDRHVIVGSLKGESQTGEISFTVNHTSYTNSDTSNPTLIDVLDGRAGWTSTGGYRFRQHCTGFRRKLAGIANGETVDPKEEFQKVSWEWEEVDGDPNKIAVTGTILDDAGPTLTGT